MTTTIERLDVHVYVAFSNFSHRYDVTKMCSFSHYDSECLIQCGVGRFMQRDDIDRTHHQREYSIVAGQQNPQKVVLQRSVTANQQKEANAKTPQTEGMNEKLE